MTCYWDSVFSQLDLEDYKFIGTDKPNNIQDLIRLLKSKNKYVDNVTWQKEKLSFNEKKEHYTAIDVYDIKGIKNGHLTSVCDSFLLLVCELFNVSIHHRFLNTPIKYENLKKSRKTLFFSSNGGHFQNAGPAKKTNSSKSRLERIRNQAINNSKNKIGQMNQKIEKRPSWRSNPEAFKRWRQQMRTMNIR